MDRDRTDAGAAHDIYGARPSPEIGGTSPTPPAGERVDEDIDSNADPDEIRANIERTREEMSETIDAIQERLSPDRLKSEAKAAVREQTIGRAEHALAEVSDTARGTGESIMDTIRNNPVPAAMAGIGIGWLVMRGRSSASVRSFDRVGGSTRRRYDDYGYGQGYGGGASRAGRMAEGVGERAGEYAGQMQERAGEYASEARERAGEYVDRAQHQAHQLESAFSRMMRENPLALGLAAFGLGAAVGLLVPETRKEEELMGETRDSLVERARDMAREKVEQVQHVAEEARQAAKEEAEHQGLTSS